MVTIWTAISLLVLSGFGASATTFNTRDTQPGSCSDGMITKHNERNRPSDGSTAVWENVFGGENGFRLSKKVVTTVNTTTTFPRYTNLLDIIRASSDYPVQWSSLNAQTFEVNVPAQQGGAIYFTATLLCFDGKLSCGGREEDGTFCSAFWPGPFVQAGIIAFVSQFGVNVAMNHSKSVGNRVGITPKELESQKGNAPANGNHKNPAARNHAHTAAKLLLSSVFISLLCL